MSSQVETLVNKEYKHGFVTDIESDVAPKGLSEDIVRLISAKKSEPEWLLEWRLKAYRGWLKMTEPHWPNVKYPPIDYQDISYYSAPKTSQAAGQPGRGRSRSCCETYKKLGIPLTSRRCSPAWRWTRSSTRSRSAPPTRPSWRSRGSSSAPSARRCGSIPSWCGSTWARWCRYSDNFFAALNSAVFSDGSFVYMPEGRALPDGAVHLLPDQRRGHRPVRAHADHRRRGRVRELPRGLHRAQARRRTSCTRRWWSWWRSTGATIKYSTVQNWYAGDEEGVGGIYNFVTKRGKALARNSKISWTQVETGSAITWKYPERDPAGRQLGGRVLLGGGGEQPAAGRHRHQDDPHRQEHPKSTIVSKGISAGQGQNSYRGQVKVLPKADGRAQLHAVRLDADREPLRRAHVPVHRRAEHHRDRGARGVARRRSARTRSSTASSAGLNTENAISMIVNGFCKEVFKELPMEFAVEAQKLLGISLEGSVG